jgi:hypothetical protein
MASSLLNTKGWNKVTKQYANTALGDDGREQLNSLVKANQAYAKTESATAKAIAISEGRPIPEEEKKTKKQKKPKAEKAPKAAVPKKKKAEPKKQRVTDISSETKKRHPELSKAAQMMVYEFHKQDQDYHHPSETDKNVLKQLKASLPDFPVDPPYIGTTDWVVTYIEKSKEKWDPSNKDTQNQVYKNLIEFPRMFLGAFHENDKNEAKRQDFATNVTKWLKDMVSGERTCLIQYRALVLAYWMWFSGPALTQLVIQTRLDEFKCTDGTKPLQIKIDAYSPLAPVGLPKPIASTELRECGGCRTGWYSCKGPGECENAGSVPVPTPPPPKRAILNPSPVLPEDDEHIDAIPPSYRAASTAPAISPHAAEIPLAAPSRRTVIMHVPDDEF